MWPSTGEATPGTLSSGLLLLVLEPSCCVCLENVAPEAHDLRGPLEATAKAPVSDLKHQGQAHDRRDRAWSRQRHCSEP